MNEPWEDFNHSVHEPWEDSNYADPRLVSTKNDGPPAPGQEPTRQELSTVSNGLCRLHPDIQTNLDALELRENQPQEVVIWFLNPLGRDATNLKELVQSLSQPGFM